MPSLVSPSTTDTKTQQRRLPLTAGHRGFKGSYPENTLKAFDHAVAVPVDVLELDIQLSQDGVLVVSHDPKTKRVFGADHVINQTPYYGVLDKLVAKNSLPTDDAALVGMPTFEQIVQLVTADQRYKDIHLMVDIKSSNPPSIIAKLVHVLTKHNPDLSGYWADRVVLGIWTPDAMLTAALTDAAPLRIVHIGVSRRVARQFLAKAPKDRLAGLSLHYLAYVSGSGSSDLQTEIRARGAALWSWTVNSDQWMRWAVGQGLDGVVTDFPDKFRALTTELAASGEEPAALRARLAKETEVPWFKKHVLFRLLYVLIEAVVYIYFSRLKKYQGNDARKPHSD